MKSLIHNQRISNSRDAFIRENGLHLLLDPNNENWLYFINSNPDANIFHHPRWAKLLSDCYGFRPFIVAVDDCQQSICAGLPMIEIQNPMRCRRWVSLPFTDHCVPLADNDAALYRLIKSLVSIHKTKRSPTIELRCNLPGYPFFSPSVKYYHHQMNLDVDFNMVAGRIHPAHRRNIRASQNKGVRVISGTTTEYIQAFYQLHLQTRQRQGIPIQPKRFFELLGKEIIDQGLGFVLLACKEGQYLAGAVFLHWQKTLTYKFGASDIRYLSLRPNDLIFWTAIQWGCENGYKVLDFGRTDLDNPGLCRFKRGWGTEETMLTYQVISKKPEKQVGGKLLKVVRPLIQRSPRWVCQMAGELFYKFSA